MTFRDNAVGVVNSVDVSGSPRVAGKLIFNGDANNFQITGLTSANRLDIDGPNSLSTPDLIVSAGTAVKIVGAGAGGTDGITGDFRVVGLSTTENFVFDIGAGASLDMQATMAGTSSSSTTRRGGVVKTGTGTLTFTPHRTSMFGRILRSLGGFLLTKELFSLRWMGHEEILPPR